MFEDKDVARVSSEITSLTKVSDEARRRENLSFSECSRLKTPEGHVSNWRNVCANRSGLRTLKGFQEGLEILSAKKCSNLAYPTDLPHSCKEAYFDGSGLKALQHPTETPDVYVPMTEGLEILSVSECMELTSLRGIASSVKTLILDYSAIENLAYLPEGIKKVSAIGCEKLKNIINLPESCEELDLSFSSIRRLEGIPSSIKKIRLYNCYSFDISCLKNIDPSILPKIEGLYTEGAVTIVGHRSRPTKKSEENIHS